MFYQFAIFITLALLLLFGGHWLLYYSIVRFFAVKPGILLLSLRILFAFLSVSFILASVLAFRFNNIFERIFYYATASWLGVSFYLLLAACLAWGVKFAISRSGIELSPALPAGILFGLAVIVGVWGLFNARDLQVTRISLELSNLPSEWRGKTMVWVSDVHLGEIYGEGTSKKIVEKINELRPEIVFVGGDLYDGTKIDLDKVTGPFGKLNAPRGVYFITGNHEEFGDGAVYLEAVRKAGMKVLGDEKVEIDGLQIVGVDYKNASDIGLFQKVMKSFNLDQSRPTILLKHSPDFIGGSRSDPGMGSVNYLEVARQQGVGLQLSGHTHLGQMYPFGYITSAVYHGYNYGLKKFQDMWVYTSSGAGTWGPPLRVGTKAEIVEIKFK